LRTTSDWRKSCYRLKQVPFKWNQAIDSHLQASGFEPMEPDPCIYVKRVSEQVVYIILYMDNCTIIGHSNLITDAKRTVIPTTPARSRVRNR
jgi:hypothetical protein